MEMTEGEKDISCIITEPVMWYSCEAGKYDPRMHLVKYFQWKQGRINATVQIGGLDLLECSIQFEKELLGHAVLCVLLPLLACWQGWLSSHS